MLLEPFAAESRFSKAAAGLKNICANLDHGTDMKSTVVAITYRPKAAIAHELPAA